MQFIKTCPNCEGQVHIRTLRCPSCGHVLRNSKSLTFTVGTRLHRKCNAASIAVSRAMETASKAQKRRKLNCERTTKIRAAETTDMAQKCQPRDSRPSIEPGWFDARPSSVPTTKPFQNSANLHVVLLLYLVCSQLSTRTLTIRSFKVKKEP